MFFFESSAKSKVKMADKRRSNNAAVSMLKSFPRRIGNRTIRSQDYSMLYTATCM